MRLFTGIVAFLILISSCSSYKSVVRYPSIDDETFANDDLRQLFKENPRPSIVLRTPNSSDKATSNTMNSRDNTVAYNAIEKELLEEGFSVRDRGLFNEIINKSESQDYSRIKDLTNTDLILEVINIDLNIVYSTNKMVEIFKEGREKEVIEDKDYKAKGYSIEFKIILVKTNEIAGSYKFQYKPCKDGCEIAEFNPVGRRTNDVELRESVNQNSDWENFMRESTKKLINSFRNEGK